MPRTRPKASGDPRRVTSPCARPSRAGLRRPPRSARASAPLRRERREPRHGRSPLRRGGAGGANAFACCGTTTIGSTADACADSTDTYSTHRRGVRRRPSRRRFATVERVGAVGTPRRRSAPRGRRRRRRDGPGARNRRQAGGKGSGTKRKSKDAPSATAAAAAAAGFSATQRKSADADAAEASSGRRATMRRRARDRTRVSRTAWREATSPEGKACAASPPSGRKRRRRARTQRLASRHVAAATVIRRRRDLGDQGGALGVRDALEARRPVRLEHRRRLLLRLAPHRHAKGRRSTTKPAATRACASRPVEPQGDEEAKVRVGVTLALEQGVEPPFALSSRAGGDAFSAMAATRVHAAAAPSPLGAPRASSPPPSRLSASLCSAWASCPASAMAAAFGLEATTGRGARLRAPTGKMEAERVGPRHGRLTVPRASARGAVYDSCRTQQLLLELASVELQRAGVLRVRWPDEETPRVGNVAITCQSAPPLLGANTHSRHKTLRENASGPREKCGDAKIAIEGNGTGTARVRRRRGPDRLSRASAAVSRNLALRLLDAVRRLLLLRQALCSSSSDGAPGLLIAYAPARGGPVRKRRV